MEAALTELIAAIKQGVTIDDAWLSRLLRRHNRAAHDPARRVAKRRLLPFYLAIKENDPVRWSGWEVDAQTERTLLRVLKMKPRRTASGVATVTVITKPWPCSSDCLYCPNDVRMPKSYLADEPACQRAERNYFDPYLQVRSRLVALHEMGHVTDKVELIVLGGTWNDYPQAYQQWFVRELFRAVNDYGPNAQPGVAEQIAGGASAQERDRFYARCGLTYNTEVLAQAAAPLQQAVNEGTLSYNEAIRELGNDASTERAGAIQQATMQEVLSEHARNELAGSRVVGLTIETRPDLITPDSARFMRQLGCTKIQMGIQSLDDAILQANHRRASVEQIVRAFEVLRLAGFKIQIHFMANLLGATAEADKADYLRLVEDPRFLPDEVKLYPCCLVESSHLRAYFESGAWQPYDTEELIDLLAADTLATPAYTRISRMIRDISSTDIIAGNKKTNLRQMVDARLARKGAQVREIRSREVATSDVTLSDLQLVCVPYTTTVSEEHFLQWVTSENHIAGFLRLSLPHDRSEAMIREVHVYGRVAAIHESEAGGAQHLGLGKRLVEEACRQARAAGYDAINVISSVGTRAYYRSLGFADGELYQRRPLS
ncbi:MAG: tRNA uridine(34) 5-carboxymethylaminomethyl modification radical SAM/GNAT enzyme Elp3 [Coriobacteriales bacterium]|nr:tRNA uridine(34) 5-carboxymethylaminomethyl modification radical SAM/GNAT enzyme Elp3 [Coriobacteriales bacterium]